MTEPEDELSISQALRALTGEPSCRALPIRGPVPGESTRELEELEFDLSSVLSSMRGVSIHAKGDSQSCEEDRGDGDGGGVGRRKTVYDLSGWGRHSFSLGDVEEEEEKGDGTDHDEEGAHHVKFATGKEALTYGTVEGAEEVGGGETGEEEARRRNTVFDFSGWGRASVSGLGDSGHSATGEGENNKEVAASQLLSPGEGEATNETRRRCRPARERPWAAHAQSAKASLPEDTGDVEFQVTKVTKTLKSFGPGIPTKERVQQHHHALRGPLQHTDEIKELAVMVAARERTF